MKFGDLIDQSIEILKTFNPVYSTVDSHADTFLKNVLSEAPFTLTPLPLDERPVRESFYKAGFLRLHTLRRIPQNLQQGLLFAAPLHTQPQRYDNVLDLCIPFIFPSRRITDTRLQKVGPVIRGPQDEHLHAFCI